MGAELPSCPCDGCLTAVLASTHPAPHNMPTPGAPPAFNRPSTKPSAFQMSEKKPKEKATAAASKEAVEDVPKRKKAAIAVREAPEASPLWL